MIESIHFQNFKCLRDTTLPLEPCTVLVGPNGSGKSTVLEALEITAGRLPTPSREQAISVAAARPGESVEIGMHWAWMPIEVQWGMRLLPSENSRTGWLSDSYGSEPELEKRARTIRLFLQHLRIYALDATRIGTPCELKPNMELDRDGFGLPGVLTDLRDQHEDHFDALVTELHDWLPEFDRIRLRTVADGKRSLVLRASGSGNEFDAADLSDGTLLALAVLTLAHLPEPPSLIGLEEPDRGMHPYLLRRVKDALYRLAYPESFGDRRDPVQVIVTTHSPYFLDEFRDHPEQIVLANKQQDNVEFRRLSDMPRLSEVLGEAALGEVWYTGILGGVPELS